MPLTLDKLPERPSRPLGRRANHDPCAVVGSSYRSAQEIDASITAKAEFEYLYEKPYEDKKKVRVAGPFTVESLSPHRTLGVTTNRRLD